MAPCPARRPHGSSLRAPAPSLADRVSSDPSRVLMEMESDAAMDGKRRRLQEGDDEGSRVSKKRAVGSVASPVAHLSCARIRPFVVQASRTKEETKVTAHGDAHNVIMKESTGGTTSCTKIQPASRSRPKKETQVSTRTVAHGVITKQKAGQKIPCTRIMPAVVKASGIKDKAKAGQKVPCTRVMPAVVQASGIRGKAKVGVLRNDVMKTKQEASQRVQEAVTKSNQPIRPPAPATTCHQDPYDPQDALRAALVAARQALDRRHNNVYARQREAARREMDKVVQTVFFDDPHITLEGVLKSLGC
ncbi:hypothetical protein QYE76_005403 [Lolium multiflorum]|uniref:Uncharacterized protein n=1 Tax=Lolium multiflorum TaxID=4521 RepID=A0AAD8RTU1_LOLMU|nr:hypothetical protein QYE76_005403 [Lolium multiflorum]